jgi:DDE superfamily endonuclease
MASKASKGSKARKRDEDYCPPVAEVDCRPTRQAKLDASAAIRRVSLDSQPGGESATPLFPDSVSAVDELLGDLTTKLKGLDLEPSTAMRVVKYALLLQKRYLENDQRHPGREPAPGIRAQVVEVFSISTHTYSKVMKAYLSDGEAYTSGKNGEGRTGNTSTKATRIPSSPKVRADVSAFIRDKRSRREVVTGSHVTKLLLEKKVLVGVPTGISGAYERRSFRSANDNTNRWLRRNGFRRGARTGNIKLKEKVALQRQDYLKEYMANKALPPEQQLRVTALDESYIHEHYNFFRKHSLYDPSDSDDMQEGKAPGKGKRWCFVAAIQEAAPRSKDPTAEDDKARLVPDSVWKFSPQGARDHKGDYHKVFNGNNFTTWFKDQLIKNIGDDPCLIIMDNAQYHKVYGPDVPKAYKMTKKQCLDWLTKKCVDINSRRWTLLDARTAVRDWVVANEKPECIRLAEEKGHRVLFTPPYHSDLQPIEFLWAWVKRNVGMEYSTGTKLSDVGVRLEKQFDLLKRKEDSIDIGNLFRHTERLTLKFYNEMMDETGEDDVVATAPTTTAEADRNEIDNEIDDDATDAESIGSIGDELASAKGEVEELLPLD